MPAVGEGRAGLQGDAVGLFVFSDLALLIETLGEDEAVAAAE